MILSQLQKGDEAVIVRINADSTLRNRLSSFGVMRGEHLKVKGCSLAKKTMEIEIEHTLLALREIEASKIEVTQIGEISQ